MIGAEGVVFVGALALGIGHWLGARTGAGMRRLWERAVLGREAYAAQLAEAQAQAADERRLREAAADHMGAYVAQVKEGQREIKGLRAQLAQAEAEAEALKVRLVEECRVTNLWIAEWEKLECQRKGLKYSSTYFNQPETPEIIAREAEGAKLAEARAQLIAQLAEAQAEAVEARARVLLAWHEADQLEASLNSAEDERDAARRDRRQAEELAEELAEGRERQLAEEVIAARVSGWLVEDQSRRYEARIARRASLSVSRRSAPSAVHGPEGGQCDDAAEKKS